MGFWSRLMNSLGGGTVGSDYYDRLLRLSPGETITFSCGGQYLVGLDKVKGNQLTRGAQYILALTSEDRLVVGDMQTMRPEAARHFDPGTLVVEDRGYLDADGGVVSGRSSYTMAGPTGVMERVKVLRFTPRGGESFALMAVESAVPRILDWCRPR